MHISNVTLSFLNGEFEVEPGYGEEREEALNKAGINTYFIVRALKPFKPAVTKSLASLNDTAEFRNQQQHKIEGVDKEDSEDFRQRLRDELDSRGIYIHTIEIKFNVCLGLFSIWYLYFVVILFADGYQIILEKNFNKQITQKFFLLLN